MIFIKNNPKIQKIHPVMKYHKAHSIKRLLSLTLPHLKNVILSAIFVLLINATLIAKPYIIKIVIDDFLVQHKSNYGVFSITSMGILYLSVVVLGSISSIAQVNLINRAGQEIMKSLRNSVYKTIQLLPLSYLDKTASGRLITRATNDVEALSEMFTDVIINLFQDVFLLLGIIYTMLVINFQLALISFSIVPVIFLIVFVLKTKIRNNFVNMKSLIGKLNGFLAENISGMKIVQVFIGEKEKYKEFAELNNAYFKTTIFQVWLNSFLKPASDLLQSFAVALLIWYGIGKISNHSLEIGVLYAFTSYVKQFFNPISDLADNYTTIQSALVSADRIFELLDQNASLEDLESGICMEKMDGFIEFKNVWFAYSNEEWILKDISFKLEKGKSAAFVGETGAGKTTITSLILGFYKVQKGEILIDGININEINLKTLRKNIAVVLQEVFLFSGNIRKNISLKDNINDEEIISALKTSQAYEFVQKLPLGLDEPVMERGNTLSAGEKQLLSFARALAHNPSVFILDEATANIDTQTEILIQKAIENIAKDRTTLIIAHRLSTIRNADKLVVLKHGEVIEIGSHSELLQKDGYYKKLLNNSEELNATSPSQTA